VSKLDKLSSSKERPAAYRALRVTKTVEVWRYRRSPRDLRATYWMRIFRACWCRFKSQSDIDPKPVLLELPGLPVPPAASPRQYVKVESIFCIIVVSAVEFESSFMA